MAEQAHTFVKICGITRLTDARAAVRAGANALGFVFASSPRRVTPAGARRITEHVHPAVRKFGVFVDSPLGAILRIVEEAVLDGVQLQGAEPPSFLEELRRSNPLLFIAKVIRATSGAALAGARDFSADAIFLDRKDPRRPAVPSRPIPPAWLRGVGIDRVVVAGGLTPENVGPVVKALHPWGVDVSRGVEEAPGRKDPEKVRAFIRAVRSAETGA